MIGNNSCGVHSVMAGKTDDNVLELDILTYGGLRMTVGPTSDDELERIITAGGIKGEIYRRCVSFATATRTRFDAGYPPIPRCVSGYNLTWLLPENGASTWPGPSLVASRRS